MNVRQASEQGVTVGWVVAAVRQNGVVNSYAGDMWHKIGPDGLPQSGRHWYMKHSAELIEVFAARDAAEEEVKTYNTPWRAFTFEVHALSDFTARILCASDEP